MLRLENIVKNYQSGNAVFPALKGVSLAFRKNEFVSILGPSGCGKTTLLNIIGGLDRYTSGDLSIEGKSTKQYTSHDWDVYRNHRIGFIFQSYNLIPHQNILENVELALTIAGYSKEEKRKKAMNALDMVGLKGAYKKMPNQLSGGQCQRVAIARALVNEPDILLGDEPTGALDSKTSVQIMDLIKNISKTKLVIMVTHNPELAKQYSTRIISLLDGKVVGDTNPYSLEDEKKEKFEELKGVKTSETGALVKPDKAKMSFWSAFKLSARNLFSKKKRTIMVIAASSIGIVGVSAVLAVSSGVKGYIANMQTDMLSGNPITVNETTLDIASVLGNLSNLAKSQSVSQAWKGDHIDIEYLTKILIESSSSGSVITNDINDYYVQYVKEISKEYLTSYSFDYGASFANNIYTVSDILETEDEFKNQKVAYSISGLRSIYTSILGFLKDGKGTDFTPVANLAANFPNVFYEGLDNNEYIEEQYEFVGGKTKSRLPKEGADDECVVVLNKRNKLPDLVVTLAGMLSEKEFMTAMYEFVKDNPDMEKIEKTIIKKTDDILKQKVYYIPNNLSDGSTAAFSKNNLKDYVETINPLRPFNYNYKFVCGEEDGVTTLSAKGTKLKVTGEDTAPKQIKIVGIITPKEDKKYGSLSSGIYFKSNLAKKIMKNNQNSEIFKYMSTEQTAEIEGEKKVISKKRTSFSNVIFIPNDETATESYHNYGLTYNLNFQNYKEENGEIVPGEIIQTYGTVGDSHVIVKNCDDPFPKSQLEIKKGTLIQSSLSSRSLAGLKAISNGKKTPGGNPDYDYKEIVRRIYIYNKDFAKKNETKKMLDKWNSKTEYITITDPYNPSQKITLAPIDSKQANSRNSVHYNDNLTIIIAMINSLIDITTISLTVFAALALVVSTVMIGIITYISVMERIKEIGVIRSLGGRKKDVSHLFNAETFILGGLSGVFGIAITLIFELILDIVVYSQFKIPMIANLKWYTAIIMILLSIVLTAISGLIPARSAANKDPVNALRSE